jgi:hypothetical protein
VYLTGATLFLSLLLARVFYITLDLITIQDELNVLKGKVNLSGFKLWSNALILNLPI